LNDLRGYISIIPTKFDAHVHAPVESLKITSWQF